MKAYNRKGEPVDLADGEILPDGFSIRVPSFLVDGIPQAMTTENVCIVDSAGRPSGSRPGFLLDSSNNEIQARIAYDKMVARAQSAWRGPSTAHAISDADTPEAAREAMIKYSENAWHTPTATVTPVADQRPITQDDLERDRERRKLALSNAWKNTSGVGFGPGSIGGGAEP